MIVWLLAFLLHSTFWLGLAWGTTRFAPRMGARTRETVWYTAVLASLIASSVHAVAPDSIASLWSLTLPGALLTSAGITTAAGTAAAASSAGPLNVPWEILLVGAWISISSLLLLWYAAQLVALRHRLAREDLPTDSREVALLRGISKRAGLTRSPRLSESENLGSPIAIGFGGRAEICVPTRALHELDQDQFCAMLAHETAHHVRRDPVRLGVANLMRTLFFFQPMFRVAWRDLHLAAEEQCDAWAAGQVEDRLAMASCLTEVAGWVLPRHRPLPVVGLMKRRSQLVRRVERLMDERSGYGAGSGFLRVSLSMSVLLLAPWLAPGLSTEIPATQPAVESGLVSPALDFAGSYRAPADAGLSSEGEGHEEEARSEGREGTVEHSAEGTRQRGPEGGEEHREEHGGEGRGR